jgi:hypothetical protein
VKVALGSGLGIETFSPVLRVKKGFDDLCAKVL